MAAQRKNSNPANVYVFGVYSQSEPALQCWPLNTYTRIENLLQNLER